MTHHYWPPLALLSAMALIAICTAAPPRNDAHVIGSPGGGWAEVERDHWVQTQAISEIKHEALKVSYRMGPTWYSIDCETEGDARDVVRVLLFTLDRRDERWTN